MDDSEISDQSSPMLLCDEYNDTRIDFIGLIKSIVACATGREEFDPYSFAGGICFGAGTSIIMTRTLKTVMLIGGGGLASLMVLSRAGCIVINWEKLDKTLKSLVDDFYGSKIGESANPLLFKRFILKYIPENHVSSAMLGSVIGFTGGFVFF